MLRVMDMDHVGWVDPTTSKLDDSVEGNVWTTALRDKKIPEAIEALKTNLHYKKQKDIAVAGMRRMINTYKHY